MLDAFYTKFTPRYVIGKLTEEINNEEDEMKKITRQLKSVLASLSMKLAHDIGLNDAENQMAGNIREDETREILQWMGILRRMNKKEVEIPNGLGIQRRERI